MVLKHETVTFH